jgi:hypothetical protein
MQHLRGHAVGYLALGVALGGTAYAAANLPANSVGTNQLKANAVVSSKIRNGSILPKDFKAGQLPAGPQGIQGIQGNKGATGVPGPTYGESHPVVAESMTAQSDVGSSTSVTTPISGKLLVFGDVEGVNVSCTAGGNIDVGLFLDGSFVPGTLYTVTPSTPQNVGFAAVVGTPVAAGSHTLVAKAGCLPAHGSPVTAPTITGGSYGVVVLD